MSAANGVKQNASVTTEGIEGENQNLGNGASDMPPALTFLHHISKLKVILYNKI